MLMRCRPIILCLAVLFWCGARMSARGADAEARAFRTAEKAWEDKFFDRAEREFAAFIAKYPASPRTPEAMLLQARAALAQKKFAASIGLLSTNMTNAAGLADQFQFQIAQAHEQSGQFAAAADAFAALVTRHTNSSLRLPATLGEAQARFQLQQWARVSELLQNPAGVFAQAAAQRPDATAVTDGRLLLAEALFEQRLFAQADKVAESIPDAALLADARWRREYLRARAQFGAQDLQAALVTSSNVVAAGAAVAKPALEAAGISLQAQILEALNQPAAAIAAYEHNQRTEMPPERVREALFKSVSLHVAQGQITNAVARLEKFLAEHPNEAGSDVALLTVAELRLKQHQMALAKTNGAAAAAPTNLLAEAIANARRVIETFTNSPFLGPAHLVRGWALLAQGNTAESLGAFRRAVETLPWSEQQAVAKFKTADLEFQSGEYTNALANYRRVLTNYASLPRVQAELVPRARYQMLQASYAARDLGAASEVMSTVVREYPPHPFGERTLLLYGQVLDELGKPARARAVFTNFVALAPQSALRPEVELAIARTFERERNWAEAIAQYDAWVAQYPTNQNTVEAEYRRALANGQAGRTTNALVLLTNFVARFRSHPRAQSAQYAVGDLYFGQGMFAEAEREYQRVYQNTTNWPTTALTWEAQLKAGRAAMNRGSYSDAKGYFTALANTETAPRSVQLQALFALGETFSDKPTNQIESLKQALELYRFIVREHPSDPLVWRAVGEIGRHHWLLGGLENPTNYFAALDAYSRVTNAPAADVSARVQAQVGIGHVLREQARLIVQTNGPPADASALLSAALENYLSVLHASYDDELPDSVWIRNAAYAAADIAESQNNWDSACRVYRRLGQMLPELRPAGLDRKTAAACDKAAMIGPP